MLSEQFSLFNKAEALAAPKVAEPDLEQITYKRRKQAGKREMGFSSLPTEQVVHELRSKERVCPEYLPLPKFPAVTRDIAVVCGEDVKSILETLEKDCGAVLR